MSKTENMSSFFSSVITGQLIQSADETPRGVFLRLVKPQPASKLVYSSRDKNWVYPGGNVWKEWQDPSYRCPNDVETNRLNAAWTSPYHAGHKVFVQEPWDFRECNSCQQLHICGMPQTKFQHKAGCFVYPTYDSRNSAAYQPAHLMPQEAARTFLRITAVRIMRLKDVPVEQFRKEGFICPDGSLFPSDLPRVWDDSISQEDYQLYSWMRNPFVWVIFFEK